MGGNGAAIRSGPIGIFYNNNIEKLIEISITSSRLTHNIPLGYLGGLVSALFASYAFNNINPCLWLNKLIELIESDKIKRYINSTDIGNKHDNEIDEYFLYWFKYKEKRFNDIINFRGKSTFIFSDERYYALSEYNTYFKKNENEIWSSLGISGIDSVIYAYDSLLMSIIPDEKFKLNTNNMIYNPEALVFYSALHIGDSDSTGAIAGFWYGALLGYNGFDKNKIKQLEFYKDLKKLSDNFIKYLIE